MGRNRDPRKLRKSGMPLPSEVVAIAEKRAQDTGESRAEVLRRLIYEALPLASQIAGVGEIRRVKIGQGAGAPKDVRNLEHVNFAVDEMVWLRAGELAGEHRITRAEVIRRLLGYSTEKIDTST